MGSFAIHEHGVKYTLASFNRFYKIDILRNVKDTFPQHIVTGDTKQELIENIRKASSLYVEIGWSFESAEDMTDIFTDCQIDCMSKFGSHLGDIVTDNRCSWFGFVPLDPITSNWLTLFTISELNYYYNCMVAYQTAVIEYIQGHQKFFKYALTRDDDFRFAYMKAQRNHTDQLIDTFWLYVNAKIEINKIPYVFRDIVEIQIGCHYMKCGTEFIQQLEILQLKGMLQ